MSNANFAIPKAYNEPVKAYLPGSPEREALKKGTGSSGEGKASDGRIIR